MYTPHEDSRDPGLDKRDWRDERRRDKRQRETEGRIIFNGEKREEKK